MNSANELNNIDYANYDWDSKAKEDVSKKRKDDPTFWAPNKKKAKTYIIRFLPDVRTKLNFVEINGHSLTHFPGGEKKYLFGNCKTTLEKGKGVCPICDYGWGLWGTKVKANQDRAKQGWLPKQEWVSNILVVRDPDSPENNGKVFKYKYGISIYKKIFNCIEPTEASKSDPDFRELNPFNPTTGADFKLIVEVSDDSIYPSYRASTFYYKEQKPVGETPDEINRILGETYDLQEYTNELQYLESDFIYSKIGYILKPGDPAYAHQDSASSDNDAKTESVYIPPVAPDAPAFNGTTAPVPVKEHSVVVEETPSTDDLNDAEMEFIKTRI